MRHRGLGIPWVDRNRFYLKLSVSCIIQGTRKQCGYLSCPECVFEPNNASIGLDYLIEQKYITTAEALEFSLDNLSEKEEDK